LQSQVGFTHLVVTMGSRRMLSSLDRSLRLKEESLVLLSRLSERGFLSWFIQLKPEDQ